MRGTKEGKKKENFLPSNAAGVGVYDGFVQPNRPDQCRLRLFGLLQLIHSIHPTTDCGGWETSFHARTIHLPNSA